jgi:GGDEF domain-containing protein
MTKQGSLNEKKSFSAGFALYDSTKDHSFCDVMNRADSEMYETKKMLKRLLNP